jgi:hypothetical protein
MRKESAEVITKGLKYAKESIRLLQWIYISQHHDCLVNMIKRYISNLTNVTFQR